MWILCLLILTAIPVMAQEPSRKLTSEEFPILEKRCVKQQRDWGGKNDWQSHCKLAVWREVDVVDSNGKTNKQREGHVLFDLPLISPHPSSYDECEARVKRWMLKDAPEILRRVGWLVDPPKKGKK